MSDTSKYSVLPKKVEPKPTPGVDSLPLEDREKIKIKGLHPMVILIMGAVLFMPIIWFLTNGARKDASQSGIVLGVCAALLIPLFIHYAVRSSRISEKEREKALRAKQSVESSNQAEVSRAEGEARNVTQELTRTYESSAVTAAELPQHLSKASNWVRQADSEFKDNAFAPFWDAVENAAQQLATFNTKATQVSQAATKYYGGLSGRAHTFPSFPTNPGNLPDPAPVLNDLRRVVRMGQTNFQFANIWEHRRTREVMIAGFRTLGDAVNNLGSVVENSVYGLQQSISSDMARLVQEEIKTRDSADKRMVEQNRMLDNIQHRRQPGIADSPSRY